MKRWLPLLLLLLAAAAPQTQAYAPVPTLVLPEPQPHAFHCSYRNANPENGIGAGGNVSNLFVVPPSGAACDTVSGLWNVVSDPLQTVRGLWTAVTHPGQTLDAITIAMAEYADRALGGDPRAIGAGVFGFVGMALPASKAGYLGKVGYVSSSVRAATPASKFYSVVFETTLDPPSYPGTSRARHFQEANEALLRTMETDLSFAQLMRQSGVNLERSATGLAPRTPPPGWTWHHAHDIGVMQLVPNAQHTPGSIFWNAMHPGGRGGYAIWGRR